MLKSGVMNNSNCIQIKKISIIFFLFWFAFIKPGIFYFISNLNFVGDLYNVIQLLWSSIVIVLFLIYFANSSDELMYCIAVYMVYLVGITLIKGESALELFMYLIRVTGVVLAIHLAFSLNRLRECMIAFVYALGINVFINCITIFFNSSTGGMYSGIIKNGYYLGYDNVHIVYTLPFLACSLFYDLFYYQKCKMITLIMHILVGSSILITKSATTMVAIAIFYFFAIALKSLKLSCIINEWTIIGVNIFIFIFFVLKRHYLFFRQLFERIVGKNLHDVRQWIWNKYEKVVFRDPILFGHGFMSDRRRLLTVGPIHAHNMYLDILFEGGVIELILFMLIIFVCLRKSRMNNATYIGVIVASIIAFMVAYQVEVYNKVLVFAVITFCYYYSEINCLERGVCER